MPKRPPARTAQIDDIFDDERFSTAMAAATAPAVAGEARTDINEQGNQAPTQGKALHHPATNHNETVPETPVEAEAQPFPAETMSRTTGAERTENRALRLHEKNVPLKARVPQGMKTNFDKLVTDLSAALGGVKLDDSNVLRPLIERLILKHEYLVQTFGTHAGELKRPANGDAIAMLEFDQAIGKFFDETDRLTRQRNRRVNRQAGGV